MSSMHGDIGAPQNRYDKRQELNHELRHETPNRYRNPLPGHRRMTGMMYHPKGNKVDKNGKTYFAHFGDREMGESEAKRIGGRYIHFTR